MVGGTGRDDTMLMRAFPGLLVKGGAEGVHCAALPDGHCVAVKIADGGTGPGCRPGRWLAPTRPGHRHRHRTGTATATATATGTLTGSTGFDSSTGAGADRSALPSEAERLLDELAPARFSAAGSRSGPWSSPRVF